ncbi:MAG: redox-regulated ATPase YchF [Pseudomonadota bacterium]
MGFKCGIVGLPNAGKSTVFNALTVAKAEVAPYPFSTIQPHQGITSVPDPRLKYIARVIQPHKVISATLEVWDIAGLVKGASKGEGLGNQFLGHIRNVDAIIHVVRCFEDQNVASVGGAIDPIRDIETIKTELILADMETLSKQIIKTGKLAKAGDQSAREELGELKTIEAELNQGIPARRIEGVVAASYLKNLQLLSSKPVLYVANVSESEMKSSSPYREAVLRVATEEDAPVVTICGKLEAELQELGEEEKQEFLSTFGFEHSGLEELVREGYRLLHLITFYTVVSKELRAWTVLEGTKAPAAAGKIHSDMERGFIKAEVIGYEDFIAAGSMPNAREQGKIVLEGRDYIIRDGDIITFKFNV